MFLETLSVSDLSPQDSTLVADIVEVGSLPSYTREFDETHHCFYILTRQGLRFECSSTSKTQVSHIDISILTDTFVAERSLR